MYTHLLVPLDGSRLAEAALPLAASLAEKLGASVTLLHVIERAPPSAVHGDRHLSDVQEAERYLAELTRTRFTVSPPAACHVHVGGEPDIAQSIAAHAEELRADLIVMCTHERQRLRHRLFGSVAQAVIGRGRTPVLLVPPGETTATGEWVCRRVLVPVDAEPGHGDAVPVALDFARTCGAAMHVLWVVPTLGTLGGDQVTAGSLQPGTTAALLELEQEQAERQVRAQVERAAARDVPLTLEIVRGAAAEVILQTVMRSDADLLVIATHGRRGFDAFWAGSVAPRVAQRMTRPVLLVPLGGATGT